LWGDRDDGRESWLPGYFRGELRSVGSKLIEESADFALVRVAESGRLGERCVVVVMRVGATGVGVRVGRGVVMVVRGEFVQAVAEDRDAAVEGGQAHGQQFSASITHESHQSGWYRTRFSNAIHLQIVIDCRNCRN
jgi:hypothetical protein